MPRYRQNRKHDKTKSEDMMINDSKGSASDIKYKKMHNESKGVLKSLISSFKNIPGKIKKLNPASYYKLLRKIKNGIIIAFSAIKRTSHFWLPAFTFCIIFTLAILFNIYTVAVEVIEGNKVVGYFENKEIYDLTKKSVEEDVTDKLGEQYSFESEPIFSFAIVKKDEISQSEKVKSELLKEAEGNIGQSYGLFVDGELLGTYKKEEGILDLLDNIKKPYLTGNSGEKIEFLKKVEIIKDMYPKSSESDLEQLRQKLLIPDNTIKYKVKKGDTAYSIAKELDTSISRLKSLNKDIDLNKLSINQEIYVSGEGTTLGIKVSRTITYEEDIPFSTTKIKSSSLYENSTQVKTKGRPGIKEITADVVLIDGVETERTITKTRVVRNPVKQQLLIGTKKIAPSGTFTSPVRGGRLTSFFNSWRGNHYHRALDIAAPRGTKIYAADGGTVVYAKWSSGYGYNVVLNHGNGIYTRYAHCSKLNVKNGQKVYKGQVIALVGSTGWSTGPHCHFEVMKGGVNGTRIDPLKVLR